MEAFLIALALFVVGWEALWWIAGVRPIGPMRLKRMLQEPGGDKPLLIDVRTAAEFRLFHVAGAENQPGLLLVSGALNSQDKKRPLVIVCLSGHRSPVVGFRLKKQGFKNVYYLSWGMLAWIVTGGRFER
ncbi:MAG: rhodanese-like domain-containing protein [Syntrophobacteraceae bacterium]|jgi:rhodanese-related sulfurtransferase